jgi:hypothetical protein
VVEDEPVKTYLPAGRWKHHLPSRILSPLVVAVASSCRVSSSVVVVDQALLIESQRD